MNSRGETVRTGDILYVVFDGRGDPLEYFRYEMDDAKSAITPAKAKAPSAC